jgi:hypothetical protein
MAARGCALVRGLPYELFFGCALSHPGRPGVQAGAECFEVGPGLLDHSEVDQGQARRSAAFQLVDRAIPCFEVELGRRRGRSDEVVGLDPHSCCVAGVQGAVGSEITDVVTGVPWGGEGLKAERVVADWVDVRFRDRCQLAP